ncbi:MAG: hypothetical protein L0G99_06335, partial [Propionibacteriales bacterium]|nr:hypothetical protein [Propionibacteriales bacterium]
MMRFNRGGLVAVWGGLIALAMIMVGACSTPTDRAGQTPSSPTGSATPPPPPATSPSPTPAGAELPRGGRKLFPTYRLVGYSGHPSAKGQGRLGIGKLEDRVVELEKRAKPYGKGRKVLPVLELITTTVHASPGKDGKYRSRTDDKIIAEHLRVARKYKGVLLLNIQPGQA